MITKQQYAKFLLNSFIIKQKCFDNELYLGMDYEKLNKFVLQSTSVGLALQTLHLLDEKYKDYINSRTGALVIDTFTPIINYITDNCPEMVKMYNRCNIVDCILTVSEMLSLLPDDSQTTI